jgi:hypothetical protein
MNKEALPLIIVILVPLIFVFLILTYIYIYDFTKFLREIEPIYYIILLPFILGAIAGIIKIKKPQ